MENKYKSIQLSFIIIIIFESIDYYIGTYNNFFIKLMMNSYIYISLFLLLKNTNKSNLTECPKLIINLLSLLILIGLFEIFFNFDENSNLIMNNYFISNFGNIYFGPMFLAPFFFLLGFNRDIIYYFEKISFLTIIAGIIINYYFLITGEKIILSLLVPSYYLLAGYNYKSNIKKIIIIIALILCIIYFLDNTFNSYRSGIVRIILSIFPILIVLFKSKKFNIFFFLALLFAPLLILYNYFYTNFIEIFLENMFNLNLINHIFTDTRTFLYKEFFNEFFQEDIFHILFGKGSLGTYYSNYFDVNYYDLNSDFYIRSISEVGIIQLILKGGFVYIFIFYTILILIIFRSINNSNNRYITIQTFNLLFFILFMYFENIPSYSFLYISFWIIAGICSNKAFIKLNDESIKKNILEKSNRPYI